MNEGQLIAAVNRLLPKTLHHQSFTNASLSHNGVCDHYYDGQKGDLWVEYKMLRGMPKNGIAKGDFTPLQLRWMTRRWTNGKNVIGVVGLPDRHAVIQLNPVQWANGTPLSGQPTVGKQPIKEIARWILEFCGPF